MTTNRKTVASLNPLIETRNIKALKEKDMEKLKYYISKLRLLSME